MDESDPTDDGPATDEESAFERERRKAREMLDDDDVTAFHVGVVRNGEEIETTYSYLADDPEREGLQALSLLATHLRIVSNEAGVDLTTAATDAATLAEQVEERPGLPDEGGP
jgi:hypothetical protein